MLNPAPDPAETPSSRKLYLLLAVALLLVGGIVLIFLLGDSTTVPVPPPPTEVPKPAVEQPMPRNASELRLALAAAVNNRNHQIRLLAPDWAEFVRELDSQVQALADAKRKCIEAVRQALGEPSAKLVAELPDVPNPWPLFAGVDWNQAKSSESPIAEIVAVDIRFGLERLADGTVRLWPGSLGTLNSLKIETDRALTPLLRTYRELETQARSGTLTAESFPNALQSARLLAVAASLPTAPSR